MTMSVRRELCGVMVFEVVEQAGTILLHHKQEVRPPSSPFLFSFFNQQLDQEMGIRWIYLLDHGSTIEADRHRSHCIFGRKRWIEKELNLKSMLGVN